MRKHKLQILSPALMAVLAAVAAGVAAPAEARTQAPQAQDQAQATAPGLSAAVRFDIRPQALDAALLEFSKQAGIQIFGPSRSVTGKKTPGIHGEHVVEQALRLLLKDSGLTYRAVNSRTVAIGPAAQQGAVGEGGVNGAALRMARVEDQQGAAAEQARGAAAEQADAATQDSRGTPEILVKGKRSLNMDIQRTEDDVQPYVVFSREEIERSQAVDLEEFLRTQLPMNTSGRASGQSPGSANTRSSVNLRGLGTDQTLLLVDGRRIPGVAGNGRPQQPDINGIPMAAVERIEVLPATAGAIYGGSATGGVVNIVLRRDFQGLDLRAAYGSTFDTDAGNMRLDANAGFSLEGGRTQVMIGASRQETNNLTVGDRDFAARAVALQLKNNPDAVTALSSPPLGATANIRSVFGTALTLDGGTPLISSITGMPTTFTHVPLGYAGPASDNGAALLAAAGTYNLDMPAGVNGAERGLVAAPRRESVSVNLRREFGARWEAFIDAARLTNKGRSFNANVPNFATLPEDAPNNPFEQVIFVRFPTPGLSFPARSESTTDRATAGLIARLPGGWTGELDYGWSRSRSESVSTSFVTEPSTQAVLDSGLAGTNGRPALNALQEGNTFPLDFSPYYLPTLPNNLTGPHETVLKDATLRLSGPVFSLPAGPVVLAALLEHREEAIQDVISDQYDSRRGVQSLTFFPWRGQEADSVHLEARAPLIGERNARRWMRSLELQLSVRHDRYRTESDGTQGYRLPSRDAPLPDLSYRTNRLQSSDYMAGLHFAPAESLALRASFATGFLPPSVIQIVPVNNPILFDTFGFFIDPKRGGSDIFTGTPIDFFQGGNANLKPERSRSWSAGLILTPAFAPGFRFSIDYTRIFKRDEIQGIDPFLLLERPELFPGRVVRAADNLPADLPGWLPPITSVDGTLINIAETQVEAYDFQADYRFNTPLGAFRAHAIATREPHFKNRILPVLPETDSVGFSGGPLEWRGNLGLTWDRGPLTLAWNAQLYDSYLAYSLFENPATVILNQGSDTIPRQIYHDLIGTYRFDAVEGWAGGLLANSVISVGIQNLFDTSPPILATREPGASPAANFAVYGDARLRRYTVTLRRAFGK
jgi:outer membrane receptor protein involved in Fe transport